MRRTLVSGRRQLLLQQDHARSAPARHPPPGVARAKRRGAGSVDDDDWELEADDDDEPEQPAGAEVAFASEQEMRHWLNNKPQGFGAKQYDTTVEEKLMEEIEATKRAQEAAKKAQEEARKAPRAAAAPVKRPAPEIPSGFEVWIANMPKKKNVERDLAPALRGTPGLLHVRPCVIGDAKTRDPVCKGFGFLTFATLPDAKRFVERFQGRKIKYGKVEKPLLCQLATTATVPTGGSGATAAGAAGGPARGGRSLPVKAEGGSQQQKSRGSGEGEGDEVEGGAGVPPLDSAQLARAEEIRKLTAKLKALEKQVARDEEKVEQQQQQASTVMAAAAVTGGVAASRAGQGEADREGELVAAEEEMEEEEEEDGEDMERLRDEIWDTLEDDDDFELDAELEREAALTLEHKTSGKSTAAATASPTATVAHEADNTADQRQRQLSSAAAAAASFAAAPGAAALTTAPAAPLSGSSSTGGGRKEPAERIPLIKRLQMKQEAAAQQKARASEREQQKEVDEGEGEWVEEWEEVGEGGEMEGEGELEGDEDDEEEDEDDQDWAADLDIEVSIAPASGDGVRQSGPSTSTSGRGSSRHQGVAREVGAQGEELARGGVDGLAFGRGKAPAGGTGGEQAEDSAERRIEMLEKKLFFKAVSTGAVKKGPKKAAPKRKYSGPPSDGASPSPRSGSRGVKSFETSIYSDVVSKYTKSKSSSR
eukprot:jgi/Mesen1/7226/ME000372S06472